MARCWDRPKTMVFNTHNFADDKPTGRFVFFDLDVIIQNDIEPLLTYNMERPTKLRSWWQDPRPMKTRKFKLAHGRNIFQLLVIIFILLHIHTKWRLRTLILFYK